MRVEHKEQEKKIEPFIEPQPIGKIVLLMGLAVSSSLLFWLAWENAIMTGLSFNFSWENILIVLSTLLAMCLMFTLIAIAEIVITNKWFLFAMAIVSAGTLFVFFRPSLWSFVAFLLVVLSLMYWKRQIRVDEDTRIKFLPQKIIDNGLRLAVTLVLLAACFSYFSFLATRPNAEQQTLDGLVSQGSQVVEGVLDLYYHEEFDPTMTLDDFLTNITFAVGEKISAEGVKVETGNEELDNALGDAITEGISVVEQEFVDETRNSFANSFEIEVNGTESMSEVINLIVAKNIAKYLDPYIKLIPALLAVGLFLLLNIFGFVYRELIKSFSFLLFHILKWTKFIYIKKIQIEAEKVSLEE
ncbi:MAG: hypothetical protein Q8P20_01885 [bacterium]|nr:hypothetical protein [bacterium]